MRAIAIAVAILLAWLSGAARADPPDRVGRLSLAEGPVWHRPAESPDWALAPVNHPVTTGSLLRTDAAARAEVQVGPVEVWLDRATTLDVAVLDDARTMLRLVDGAIGLRLREGAAGIRIDTHHGPVLLQRAGRYRLAYVPSGEAAPALELAVFEGEASIAVPGAALVLRQGEGARVGGEPVRIAVAPAQENAFDLWVAGRERTVTPVATRHVSPEMTGWQDLDRHGEWQSVPEYGVLWYPQVLPAGWEPYRHGRWVLVSPWGWTWIDDAPWGFAPFHYGRWVRAGGRWGWWPGAVRVRPVYAPALVVFAAGGVRSGGHLHPPAAGWKALGPRDAFRPQYRASAGYLHRLNAAVARPAPADKADTAPRPDLRRPAAAAPGNGASSGAQRQAPGRRDAHNAVPHPALQRAVPDRVRARGDGDGKPRRPAPPEANAQGLSPKAIAAQPVRAGTVDRTPTSERRGDQARPSPSVAHTPSPAVNASRPAAPRAGAERRPPAAVRPPQAAAPAPVQRSRESEIRRERREESRSQPDSPARRPAQVPRERDSRGPADGTKGGKRP